MRRLVSFFLFWAGICCLASAQVFEKVYLKNGRSFDGYISEQIPGKEITVMTKDGPEHCLWSEVLRTEKIISGDSGSGVMEVLELKSGEIITGKIEVQNIGKDVTVETADHNLRSIPADDIVSIKSEPVSRSKSLWEQIPLLDRLVFKDSSSVEGFIVSRKMGESVSLIQKNRFKAMTYPISDICKYEKIMNSEYSMADSGGYSIEVEGNEVKLAEVTVTGDKVFVGMAGILQMQIEDSFKVEVRNLETDPVFKLYKMKYDDDSQTGLSGYSFGIYDKSVAESSVQEDVSGKLTAEVSCRKQGVYFLSVKGVEKGIILECYK